MGINVHNICDKIFLIVQGTSFQRKKVEEEIMPLCCCISTRHTVLKKDFHSQTYIQKNVVNQEILNK